MTAMSSGVGPRRMLPAMITKGATRCSRVLSRASDADVAIVIAQIGRAWSGLAREIGPAHRPWMFWSIGRVLALRERSIAPRSDRDRSRAFRRMTRISQCLVSWRWSVEDLEAAYQFYVDEPDVTAERVLGAADVPSTACRDLARRFPLSWAHYRLLLRRVRSVHERRWLAAEAARRGWAV